MLLICLLLIGLIAMAIEKEKELLSAQRTELVPIRVIDKQVETRNASPRKPWI